MTKYDSGRYYAAAGIGGGGGTDCGGSGGTIAISGGSVFVHSRAAVYDSETGDEVSEGGSGAGVGAAGIGGGNGASGGTITISGGTIEAGAYVSPDKAASATSVPALIGGGSAGGAGNITISGGHVTAWVYAQANPVYGSDAATIGQGKGATDAGGFVKITGGAVWAIAEGMEQNTYTHPIPWPTAADGSTALYPVSLITYDAQNLPENLNLFDDAVVSMTITDKSDSKPYAYGFGGVTVGDKIWLPLSDSDIAGLTENNSTVLYDLTFSVKKDNTVYSFSGTISFRKSSSSLRGVYETMDLTYGGQVVNSLQITSDWGNQVKTYDGLDHMPTFTVKNSLQETLTKGTDYTLTIQYKPNDGSGAEAEAVETKEIKNAGGYYVTATGVAGTDYEGMTATLDELWINPKHITGIYSGGSFTKQYDGTDDVCDGNGDAVDSITLTIHSTDLCTGDTLTDIVSGYPRYASTGVGTGIAIEANGSSYTYKQNGTECKIFNYEIDSPSNLTGDITVKIIGATNLDASDVTVSKIYDGTTNCALANVTGAVKLKDLVGNEVAAVSVTGVSAFDGKDVSGAHKVTLSIGDLTGANAANYTLAGGATTVNVTDASILPADYAFNLTEAQQKQEFTQGGGLSQISLPQSAAGISGETVSGTVTVWHDEACTENQADDDSVNALTVGDHDLYVKFVPDSSESNYTDKVTTGKVVVLAVVEGAPQDVAFETPDTVTKTYGDEPFTNAAANSSEGGGAITYASSDTSVAEVESDGEVTIKGAGSAVITATAAKVEGQYRETSVNYTLTVSKKAVTVTADDAERKFGEANPAFTIADPSGVLVGGDEASDLAITLTTAATEASNAGSYDITGTSASANYTVSVTSGTLTIAKADAPTVPDIAKSLLYSQAHANVAVQIAGLPVDAGTTGFVAGSATGDDILDGAVTNTAAGIQFSTKAGSENQTATIPVTVTMQNYADVIVNVTVTLVNKTPVTITGITAADKTYDGKAVASSGTPENGQGYTGTYEYVWSSGAAPKDAGSYTLTVKIPEDNAQYMGELKIAFTISKKALTVKPQNISIYNGAALPAAFALEYVGIVRGDTITPSGTPKFALKNGADTLTGSSVNGTYSIEWTNKADVTVEHPNYTVTKADGTLTIASKPSSGGSSSAGAVAPTPAVSGSTATTTAATKTGSDGTVTASVTQAQVSSAITSAQKAAKSTGQAPRVEIQVAGESGAAAVQTTLPKSAVQALATGGMESLTLNTPSATMDFDARAIIAIAGAASGDVTISAAQVENSTLSEAAAKVVGSRPVYNFSVTTGDRTISQFGGAVKVRVPYTPEAGENTHAIVAYYINADGEPELMQDCRYDAGTGALVFTTTHFSTYAVGYNMIAFSDVSDTAWYADAVTFLAARGVTSGTTKSVFSPDAALTRGQFITLLMRAYGMEPADSSADNFADAGNAYYTGYLAAAKKLGISSGVGGNKFAPEQAVTRQEMFTLLYNALKAIDLLPEGDSGKTLSDFSDGEAVADWAQEAMSALVKSGTVSGSAGKLALADGSTRAEMAQVLYNLLGK